MTRAMLTIDLTGKRALVAGVADDGGFGFAIAKALAEAGATVSVATLAARARHLQDDARARQARRVARACADGGKLAFAKIYPLDAEFDALEDAPAELRDSRRYRDVGDFSIARPRERGRGATAALDIVVHSLANGPEVKKPLLETSRKGYLSAVSASAYSMVSMVQRPRAGRARAAARSCRCRTWRASAWCPATAAACRRRRRRSRATRACSRSRPAASGATAST